MRCANCHHQVDGHALNGCRWRRGNTVCPCLFSYDPATKFFNDEARPVDPCFNGHLKGCEHAETRQCRAEWHPHRGSAGEVMRCTLQVTEATRHDGDHRHGDFRWTEERAVYPLAQHLQATAAQINENLAAASQVGGDHYRQTKIQPWDIIDDWSLDFYRGNALKYLLRAGRKGPALQDLEKARHYIEKCIEREQASGKE